MLIMLPAWAYKQYKAEKAAKEEEKQGADPNAPKAGENAETGGSHSEQQPSLASAVFARSSLRSPLAQIFPSLLSLFHHHLLYPHSFVSPSFLAMASPDVVAPALLLPIPVLSLALSVYNCLLHRSTPVKGAVLVLLAILPAVAGGSALSVACGEPLRLVAKVFTTLLHTALSGISIYAFSPSSHTSAFPPPFLGFFLSLAALLVICELVSALIPTSPLLLPATLALVARGILLTLAITAAILLRHRHADYAAQMNIEKGQPADRSSGKSPGRVSSPTPATWPFPASHALKYKSRRGNCPANQSTPPDLPPSIPSRTHNLDEDAFEFGKQNLIFLPLVLMTAQIFATLSAALNIAASILVDSAVTRTNQSLPHILLVSAACTLLWSITVLTLIQLLPTKPHPYSSEKQVAMDCKQGPPGRDLNRFSRDNPAPRTPKPSLYGRESDSLLDFLSLRDPFASLPPPPPPLPPVGLGLDEVDVGWNGNKEIGVQYRFPAPRSIVKGGQPKGKKARASGKKRLVHQDSARTLLPVPETRGTETDVERDRVFGDEVRLAQLLLQSLSEGGEDCDNPNASTPVPTVQRPQVAHVQQSSRWSTSTTIQSIMSASVSNRSGVSTYTTCASEKVPTSRISMNTIASAFGSRKSSEAKRKSATTASSSKG
ncbi:hypothetical protein J3R82DRAFT_10818 [Butyriboletus roseoflavus]|nr:hypothetical protein J3R82DRAFT_10818 [Butyriboletus roseoflavus]